MSYGELKIDTITFTSAGVDASVSVSGLVQNPTFTGNITTTGTISGDIIRGNTISGVTITGDTGNFTSGIFSTGTAAAPTIVFDGDPDTGFFSSVISGTTTQHVSYALSGVETLRLTNGGGDNRIQLNNFTSRVNDQVLIEDTGSTRVTIVGNTANGAEEGGGYLGLARAGAGSLNSFTSLASGNVMGKVEFRAANGVGNLFVGASIESRADRNTGSTSTPGNLGFYTTASGSTTPTERMHINSEGNVGIGTADPAGFTPSLQLEGTDPGFFLNDSGTSEFFGMNVAAGEVLTWVEASADFAIGRAGGLTGASYTESLRVTSSGQLLVGRNSTAADVRVVVQGRPTDADAQGDLLLTRNGNPTGAGSGLGQIQFSNDDDIGAAIAASSDAAWTSGSNHPSRLTFSTTPTTASTPTERMRIDNQGKLFTSRTLADTSGEHPAVQINTISTGTATNNFSTGIDFQTESTTRNRLAVTTNNNWIFYRDSGSNEALRIDGSGRLLVGTNSTSTNATMILQGYAADANDGGIIRLATGKATPANNDVLGYLNFADSTHTAGAQIRGERDGGTWSGTSKPGRLVFSTVADGASSPTEQLRITSDRFVRLASGTGGLQFGGDTAAANALDDYEENTWTPTITSSSSGGATFSWTTQSATYTKIGRLVVLSANVTGISWTGSPSGYLQVQNAPFTKASSTFPCGALKVFNMSFGADAYNVVEFITASTTTTLYFRTCINGSNGQDLQISSVSNGSGGFTFTICYFV